MPPGWPDAPDAAHPRVRRRGLQLLAPGPIWRACLSAASGDPTIRTWQGFCGCEFVITERAANGQRADVVPLRQGDAVVITVNQRPAMGKRGVRKVAMRHGVSLIRSGRRHTVGLIFHDSR